MIQPVSVREARGSDARPVYNIKAVAEATGLPPATLRAWERRYGALSPSRTEGGYRLYSERDIALLRWLKERVDEGMTISQAMVLWRHRGIESQKATPVAESSTDISSLRQSLVAALTNYDESEADRTLAEAFAVFGVETVSERMIVPTMVQIGERWHSGRASTAAEHFASNYLRRKIESLISAGLHREEGPLIVLGCAPDDWHELGLLLIYLFLQRRGHNVLYLGQNVPVDQFAEEMRHLSPALVMISATTESSVQGVRAMAETVQAMDSPRPAFGFGGSVFNAHPDLRSSIPGVFMGENAREALASVGNVLSERRK